MTNTSTLTFQQALQVLENRFGGSYVGTSTVKEMTTDLISAICFENEEPTTVYHIFETKEGPNTMVKDNQVITLALHYVWELLLVTSKVPL